MSNMTKERLMRYLYLREENEHSRERLARLRCNAEMPPAVESDGSQRSGANKGKLENAVICYIELDAELTPRIEINDAEMREIRAAISSLNDPLEREVLRARYIDSDSCRHMMWADVAYAIYGDNDERFVQAAFKLHARALQNIEVKEIQDNSK
ncbi:MAG: hypothetical protein RR394_10015 [Oscillospiraceae bacterium]